MIKDSGNRTEFATGAKRDMGDGKGRFDLMPLDIIGEILDEYKDSEKSPVSLTAQSFLYLELFKSSGDESFLYNAIESILAIKKAPFETMLELAKHFENGARKYGENNWQKGIPTNSYIDSACRHLIKFMAGYTDEPHYVASIWNIVCCIWTAIEKPEINIYAKTFKAK